VRETARKIACKKRPERKRRLRGGRGGKKKEVGRREGKGKGVKGGAKNVPEGIQ